MVVGEGGVRDRVPDAGPSVPFSLVMCAVRPNFSSALCAS